MLCISWFRSLSSSSGAFLSASFSYRTYAWWCLYRTRQCICIPCRCNVYRQMQIFGVCLRSYNWLA